MNNPEYLVAINLPIREDDDRYGTQEYQEAELFDLSSDESNIDIIKEYISDLETDSIFIIELIKPDYECVYQESDWRWNYDDRSAKWDNLSESEWMDIYDIEQMIGEWTWEREPI